MSSNPNSFRLYNSNFVTQRFNLQYKSFSQLELLEQSWKWDFFFVSLYFLLKLPAPVQLFISVKFTFLVKLVISVLLLVFVRLFMVVKLPLCSKESVIKRIKTKNLNEE